MAPSLSAQPKRVSYCMHIAAFTGAPLPEARYSAELHSRLSQFQL